MSGFWNKMNHFRSEAMVGATEWGSPVSLCSWQPSTLFLPVSRFILKWRKYQTNVVTSASSITSVTHSAAGIWAGARAVVMSSSPSFSANFPWAVNAAGLTAGRDSCLPPGFLSSLGKISLHGADAWFFFFFFLYFQRIILLFKITQAKDKVLWLPT